MTQSAITLTYFVFKTRKTKKIVIVACLRKKQSNREKNAHYLIAFELIHRHWIRIRWLLLSSLLRVRESVYRDTLRTKNHQHSIESIYLECFLFINWHQFNKYLFDKLCFWSFCINIIWYRIYLRLIIWNLLIFITTIIKRIDPQSISHLFFIYLYHRFLLNV